MAVPQLKCEVTFATAPLAASPTWVDISTYVLQEGFTVRRGRSSDFDNIQASTATILLNNKDRRFDPLNASSPYSPNVTPARRIRLYATWASTDYPLFTGYVESWEPQMQGRHEQVQVRATDAFGSYFARTQFGDETLVSTVWDPGFAVVTVAQTGIAPGDRKVIVAMPTMPSGGSITIRLTGTSLGGGASTEDITMAYPTLIKSSVFTWETITSITPLASSGSVNGLAWTLTTDVVFPSTNTGTRLYTLLRCLRWTDTTVIDVGKTVMPAETISPTTTIAQLMIDAINAENGRAYISGAGVINFWDRHRGINEAALFALTNTALGLGINEIPYESIKVSTADRYLYNEIIAQAEGGTAYTLRDATSITAYFRRTLSRTGLKLATTTEAYQLAQWLLQLYKDPRVRINELVARGDLGSTWANALALELFMRTVAATSPIDGTAPVQQRTVVQQLAYTGKRGIWTVAISLSPGLTDQYWILGTSALGSTTRLAY